MIFLRHDFIDTDTEQEYLKWVDGLFAATPHHKGTGGNRSRIVRFGWDYTEAVWLRDIPDWLQALSDRIGEFDSITVNEYKPGDKIEPHIDSPDFDDLIAILALGADCRMVFTSGSDLINRHFPQRALLEFSGEHRSKWKHSIPPLEGEETRISIVFRKRIV